MTTETRERITESTQARMATKADLAASETRLIKWMVGIAASVVVAMVSLTVAAITVLYRLLS